MQKEEKDEIIIPEKLFKEPIENKIVKNYNPKSLKQIGRENIKKDGKQLNKELAKKMKNPYYFTDRAVRVGFNITLDNHQFNHANCKLTILASFPEGGIEHRYINKIMKEMSVVYARFRNQYKFKYLTVFSARFHKQDEDNEVLDETELFINLNINDNLTETDIYKTDIASPSEHQFQQ